MAALIQITSEDFGALPVFLTRINSRAVRQAVARSIKRTTDGIRTSTIKEIQDRKLIDTRTFPVQKIRTKLIYQHLQASVSDDIDAMYGIVGFRDIHLSLAYFFARPSSKPGSRWIRPVEVRELGVKRISGGFQPSPRRPIFIRTQRQTWANGKRLPIRKMFGPSLAYLLQTVGAGERLRVGAIQRYLRELDTNLSYFLARI